jgi:ribosomal protein S18 acetylase RimI-like enzyme
MSRPLYEQFNIRAGDIADLDAVISLWQQLPGLMLRAEDTPEALQVALNEPALNLYVAECASKIAAAVLVGADGRRAFLYHLAVAERHQGLGLGRRLVEFALEELAARGISRTHVFVQGDNEHARGFWGRLGWQQRNDLTIHSHSATETSHAR